MKKLLLAVVLTGVAGLAQAADCAAFNTAIQMSLKDLSYETLVTLSETNAIARLNDSTDKDVAVNLIRVNLSLMGAASCPLPAEPIDANAYNGAAIKCVQATGAAAARAVCDQSKWARDAPKPAG